MLVFLGDFGDTDDGNTERFIWKCVCVTRCTFSLYRPYNWCCVSACVRSEPNQSNHDTFAFGVAWFTDEGVSGDSRGVVEQHSSHWRDGRENIGHFTPDPVTQEAAVRHSRRIHCDKREHRIGGEVGVSDV